MSRSYRKNPVIKDRYGSKALRYIKRLANRKIRRSLNIYNYSSYKRVFCSWEIHDYKWRESKYDYIKKFNDESGCHKKYRYLHDYCGCEYIEDVITQHRLDYLRK